MKHRILGLFALATLLVGIFSCNQKTESSKSTPEELAAGFQLLEANCFTCHSPRGSIESRIAPPMIAIKKHYIDENTTKEEFTKDLVAFVSHPSEDISKMPGARRKFGLMPQMNFSEEQLTQIAAYLFETEIEAPDWFEEHYKQERKRHGKTTTSLTPLEQGKQFAMATKAILGKNLLSAIGTKGTAGAVEFCNTKAIHLTDSMASAQGVKISRVSDQPRNSNNTATGSLIEPINKFKASLSSGQTPSGASIIYNGKLVHVYPIITNTMCLQCHGEKETQIKPETLKKLDVLYPTDQATGYSENELRGIWVVEMD
ncbi:MAG: DUF3365 domain-containing protein [Bacteroidia bacterium]|nr:DUF3365 domain-containing protein [Bacteroidia bacterium]